MSPHIRPIGTARPAVRFLAAATAAGACALVAALAAHAAASDDVPPTRTPNPSRALRQLVPVVIARGGSPSGHSLEDRMRHYNVPGVSIAIIYDSRIEPLQTYGIADADLQVPVDTSTLFQAGSISKTVAAMAALRLAERGTIDLDSDVNRWLRSWKVPRSRFTATHKVTVRRILRHSAGLSVPGFMGYHVDDPAPTLRQILDGLRPANSAPVRNDTVPGHRWHPSGGGYVVLQQLLEDVSRQSFVALARELVLDPVGMRTSTFENPLPVWRVPDAAAGHDPLGRPISGKRRVYPEMAAAGLWSRPADLARFAIAIQRAAAGDSTGPVSPSLAARLLTPDTLLSLGGHRWGLGLTLEGAGDTERFGHAGADEGFISQMVAFRRGGLGAVVMTNGDRGGALAQEIIRAIATEYEWPALQPVAIDTVPTDSAIAADVAGRYVNYVSGRDTAFVRLDWHDGHLGVWNGAGVRPFWAQPDGRFTDPLTSDTFWAERDPSGRVVAVLQMNLWQQSTVRRLARAPGGGR